MGQPRARSGEARRIFERARGAARRRTTRSSVGIAVLAIVAIIGETAIARGGTNVWTTDGPAGGLLVTALAIDPVTSTTLYAASSGGVFKSLDGSMSWAPANAGLDPGDMTFQTLVINPRHPATLFFASGYDGVFKSPNGGANWAESNAGLTIDFVLAVALAPAEPAIMYAGAESRGVWKSADGAASWSPADMDLSGVRLLAVDPATPATMYAATDDGLLKSTDAAITFAPASTGLPDGMVNALVIDPTDGATLYAGTDSGVFKSEDGAVTWTPANTGLTALSIDALAIDPATPATLYAGGGDDSGAVFKSVDGGAHWAAMSAGLTVSKIVALAIDPKRPATLYAGSFGSGVFRLDQQAVTPTATPPPFRPADSSSCQIVSRSRPAAAWLLLAPAALLIGLRRRR